MYVCMCIYVVFCKIDHCIHIHWCIVMGLGHNDPWVESHMWPQQTWGQRSSRGQWPLVQVFGKRVSVSTYFDVFSNLILQWLQKYVIGKAGETHGSRTALFVYPKGGHHFFSFDKGGSCVFVRCFAGSYRSPLVEIMIGPLKWFKMVENLKIGYNKMII